MKAPRYFGYILSSVVHDKRQCPPHCSFCIAQGHHLPFWHSLDADYNPWPQWTVCSYWLWTHYGILNSDYHTVWGKILYRHFLTLSSSFYGSVFVIPLKNETWFAWCNVFHKIMLNSLTYTPNLQLIICRSPFFIFIM